MKPFSFLFRNKNSIIANTAKVYPFSLVRNSIISDFTYVAYNCTINNCTIGKFCSIASGVKIGLGKHPVNFISTSPLFYSPTNPLRVLLSKTLKFIENEPVTIGNDVWIGANVVILDNVTIGNGAIIGANSVVTKDVEPYTIIGGVPAKLLRKRFAESIINKLNNMLWWDMPLRFFELEEVKIIFCYELTDESINRLESLIVNYLKE